MCVARAESGYNNATTFLENRFPSILTKILLRALISYSYEKYVLYVELLNGYFLPNISKNIN
jgi:hypothetical protein